MGDSACVEMGQYYTSSSGFQPRLRGEPWREVPLMSPTSRMSPGGAARQRGPMAASQGPRSHVQMVVPSWNLQFMAFWVALAGGLFAAEGLDVDVAVAAEPLD